LQHSIMRTSMANYRLIDGMETTRERPCYIGQSARFRITFHGVSPSVYEVTMTLTEVVRGAEADAFVRPLLSQITNRENVLAPGMEFAVCTFEIIVITEDNRQQTYFNIYDFETITEGGRAISTPILLADESVSMKIGPGSGSGTLSVILPAEIGRNTTIRYQDKVWFSLMQPPQ